MTKSTRIKRASLSDRIERAIDGTARSVGEIAGRVQNEIRAEGGTDLVDYGTVRSNLARLEKSRKSMRVHIPGSATSYASTKWKAGPAAATKGATQ